MMVMIPYSRKEGKSVTAEATKFTHTAQVMPPMMSLISSLVKRCFGRNSTKWSEKPDPSIA